MNVSETIDSITAERIAALRPMYPVDIDTIEAVIRTAVAQGIDAALKSVVQDYPFSGAA